MAVLRIMFRTGAAAQVVLAQGTLLWAYVTRPYVFYVSSRVSELIFAVEIKYVNE